MIKNLRKTVFFWGFWNYIQLENAITISYYIPRFQDLSITKLT